MNKRGWATLVSTQMSLEARLLGKESPPATRPSS